MKRFVMLLALTALLMVAFAVPAFAAASPTANCVGQLASGLNSSPFFPPGGGGQQVSETAKAGQTSENATFCAHSR